MSITNAKRFAQLEEKMNWLVERAKQYDKQIKEDRLAERTDALFRSISNNLYAALRKMGGEKVDMKVLAKLSAAVGADLLPVHEVFHGAEAALGARSVATKERVPAKRNRPKGARRGPTAPRRNAQKH